MATKIKVRRGLLADLPSLDTGEFGLTTDTGDLYIGTDTGNELLAKSSEVALKADATTSVGSTGDGYLAFFTGTNVIAGDNDLYWDRVNNKLYIGASGYLKNDNNLIISTTGGSADLVFATQDIERMTIDQDGTGIFWGGLGVGASPSAKLEVATDAASGYIAKLTNSGDNPNRYGIQIAAGSYDGVTGSTSFIDFLSGDQSVDIGYINNTSGNLAIGTDNIDRMVINQDGYVGFGKASPNAPIDVECDMLGGFAAKFFNKGGTDDHSGIEIRCGDASGSMDGAYIVCYDYYGVAIGWIENIGGTFKLTDPSDMRLKKDIGPTKINGLDKINNINLYEFIKIRSSTYHPIGFIAQQLQEIVPEAVSESQDGILSVSKEALVPHLVKAMQELSAQVEELKKEVAELKSK